MVMVATIIRIASRYGWLEAGLRAVSRMERPTNSETRWFRIRSQFTIYTPLFFICSD